MSSADPIKVFDRKRLRHRRERAAQTYQSVAFLKKRVAEDIIDRIGVTNRNFPTSVELGCGAAPLGTELAPFTGHFLATDMSPKLAKRYGALVCDEEWLPFRNNSLDLVISALSLHWVNDLPGTLIQINRALKPDGYFVGAMIGGETLTELRQVLLQAETDIRGGAAMRVSPFADVSDLSGLLHRTGFAMPVSDREKLTIRYDNLFALLKDLKSSGETFSPQEPARPPLSPRMLMRAGELYHEQYSDPDGRIRVTVEILWMTGWAPHKDQPKPKRPGSATASLAEAVGAVEHAAGDKTPIRKQK